MRSDHFSTSTQTILLPPQLVPADRCQRTAEQSNILNCHFDVLSVCMYVYACLHARADIYQIQIFILVVFGPLFRLRLQPLFSSAYSPPSPLCRPPPQQAQTISSPS